VARQIWPFPDATNPLERLGVWTYPENQRLVPHPFLQYVKSGPRQTGDPPADQTKEPNTLRIITLGGSTTDNEWPMTLGDWLQAHAPRESGSWDVVNLATQGYSTAHSLATLALNGLDYEPDVVLVHHGWNDGMAWGAPEGVFRGDYWHALDTVTPPRIPDRFLVRASVLYRWLAYGTESVPEWATLNNWRPWPWEPRPDHGTPRELATYRRNLESIVAVARHHGAHPVFVTIPHSSSYQGKESARLADANAVTRELAGDLGIDLLDLEADWSEEDQRHFVDLAHLHSAGLLVKAEYVGRFLADLEVLRVE
jgi:lysophospholipase L1-like esterase